MINHKYIDHPILSSQDIDEKNNVVVLLWLISVGQITWFSIIVIARGAQGLVITWMEFTTAAFILCSFGTTCCWWYKGADVAVSRTLNTTATVDTILTDRGDAAAGPYHRTSLDFILSIGRTFSDRSFTRTSSDPASSTIPSNMPSFKPIVCWYCGIFVESHPRTTHLFRLGAEVDMFVLVHSMGISRSNNAEELYSCDFGFSCMDEFLSCMHH